jgi:hypothetical protein
VVFHSKSPKSVGWKKGQVDCPREGPLRSSVFLCKWIAAFSLAGKTVLRMVCQTHKRHKRRNKHAEMRNWGREDHKIYSHPTRKFVLPDGVAVAHKALDFAVHVRPVVGQLYLRG